MPKKPVNIYDTAIHVRIKRYDQTYFILCDEYETVATLKGRMLAILDQIGFKMPKQEEDLTVDDLRFTIRNRVSCHHFCNPLQILDPEATCHDQQVFNDTVVYCLVKIPDTKDEYEDLEKVSGQVFEYDYPQKKKEEPKKTDDD